jgi:hypothetical protein
MARFVSRLTMPQRSKRNTANYCTDVIKNEHTKLNVHSYEDKAMHMQRKHIKQSKDG